jgi:hypothetical protein
MPADVDNDEYARRIFIQGQRFHLASFALNQKNNEGGPWSALGMPLHVMAAFASELYFKSLTQLQNGSFSETHNLYHLFMQLTPTTRQAVSKRWKNLYTPDLVEAWKKADFLSGKVNTSLKDTLEAQRDLFERWRYIFEFSELFPTHTPNGDTLTIFHLPNVLETYILDSTPWMSGLPQPTSPTP